MSVGNAGIRPPPPLGGSRPFRPRGSGTPPRQEPKGAHFAAEKISGVHFGLFFNKKFVKLLFGLFSRSPIDFQHIDFFCTGGGGVRPPGEGSVDHPRLIFRVCEEGVKVSDTIDTGVTGKQRCAFSGKIFLACNFFLQFFPLLLTPKH